MQRASAVPIWATGVVKLRVTVTRDEQEPPPGVVTKPDGTRSWVEQHTYFQEREKVFNPICSAVLRRLFEFFRYRCGQPLIDADSVRASNISQPTWTDDTGSEPWTDRFVVRADGNTAIRTYPRMRMRAYAAADRDAHLSALSTGVTFTLRDALLAQAKDGIAAGHLLRGILELAVACEVGVKQHFFRPASPAEAAFAYLQDANRSTAPIIDFLNQIAKAAHGVSFRDDAPDDYRRIDYLFRCRNTTAPISSGK